MACKFSGTPDETGFIMLHVYINELTPSLIESIHDVAQGKDKFCLKKAADTMVAINSRRKEMW